jgi:hypothetical protein
MAQRETELDTYPEQSASPGHGTLRKITDELGITGPDMRGGESSAELPSADATASDDRVREEVCEHLWRGAHVDGSDVSVQVHHGLVTLEGTVPFRQMKYAIEDIVASCRGVHDVENRIRVSCPE